MLIVENAGQWPAAARFQVWNSPLGAGTTWLAEDAIWLVVASGKLQVTGSEGFADSRADLPPANLQLATLHALKLTFPGSNPDVRIEPFDPVTTTVSYFIGNDPDQWRLAVPVWGRVRYVGLYPGVDLVLGGRDNAWQLEAALGAAVERVRVQVEGAAIAALDGLKLQLDVDGEPLSVTLPSAPLAYRASGVSRQGEPLTLTVDPGPRASQPASPVDDPADLLYGTFLGGSYSETGYSIAIDGAGSVYVTGNTWSSDFPTTSGAFDPSYNGNNSNTFVAKLNPAGSELAYATFLGGSALDYGHGIVVDATGSAYLTGGTQSNDFPTTPGSFDRTHNGQYNAFVAKLNPVGSELVCATFLGGNLSDDGYGIDVDGAGSAYVTGFTRSSNFPTTSGAFDSSYNGSDGAFVVKLNPDRSELAYASFLGGNAADRGLAITVDEAGITCFTGLTSSSDFPTTPDAFDPTFNGGEMDVFVTKLDVFEPPSAVALASLQAGHGSNGRFARLVAAALGLMVMVSLRMLRQQKPSNRQRTTLAPTSRNRS
jgi:hypothetical protein